jgi:hypothetical protein
MGLIAKIKRLVTGKTEPEREERREEPSQHDVPLGGGSPHDLAGSRWAGSFRDE